MTMLSHIPRYPPATAAIRRSVDNLLTRFGRLVNRLVAAAIARHERHAALVALGRLSDRELQDIGLCRCQLGPALDEAAETRARMQRSG